MELVLSKKDLIAFEIISDFRAGKISRCEAALKLGVCERSVQRKAKKVRVSGLCGLIHGNRGTRSTNMICEQEKARILDLYKKKYFDFNFRHAFEMLKANESLDFSYSTFVRLCRSNGLGRKRRRRPSKRRVALERMANEGTVWQLDGSPHKWNGTDKWTMIRLIDDATSKTPAARFFNSETTLGCMQVLREAIERYGRPEIIITDRAGWSTGSDKRRQFSQFVRACEELDIKVVAVSSPEAKGRVERSFRTDQDRLIPELRLNKIKTMTKANEYLNNSYIPEWNKKRSVYPTAATTRYRPLDFNTQLDDIFCLKHKRIVNRDQTVYWKNKRYRIEEKHLGNLWKKEVDIYEYSDRTFCIGYQGEKLFTTPLKTHANRWRA